MSDSQKALKQTEKNFCEKGHLLVSKENTEYPDKIIKYCKRCNEDYEYVGKRQLIITEAKEDHGTLILESGMGSSIPGYHCKNCGNDTGYYHQVQIDPCDEPAETLIKCGKCGKVERMRDR